MEETKVGKESLIARTQKNILDYFSTHDMKYVAEDAVYHNLVTGETHKGRAEIGAMLHFMYHVAFDAKAEVKNYVVSEDKAVIEAMFTGRHIGEFYGIQPTQKEINVPLNVSYEFNKDGLIKEARIYLLSNVLLQQLGATTQGTPPRTTYITRDIFHLKYGHYRDVKALLDEGMKNGLMPNAQNQRLLTDFTGEAYRVIMEEGFNTLEEFEKALSSELRKDEWQRWYHRFIEHVDHGYREILKQVM